MACLVLALGIFALTTLRQEEARLRKNQENLLAIEARQLGTVIRTTAQGPVATETAAKLARVSSMRVTLLATDGHVLFDSQAMAAGMENHADRPEVQAALAGKTGYSWRWSKTLRADLLYLAVPLRQGGKIIGVLRVARSQREVTHGLAAIRRTFLMGTAVAAVLALLFAVLFLGRISKPLGALEKAAQDLGAGDLRTRVREFGQDELGLLARAFNRMAAQLGKLVANLTEERSKVLTILAAMSDGVILFDERQRVSLANRAAAEYLGLQSEKMPGLTPAELLLPPPALALITGAIRDQAPATGEFEVHQPHDRLLGAMLAPVRDAEQRPYGTLLLLHDLTAMRHLERIRQDFVANASHELKSPLASMKIMIETLLAGKANKNEAQRFLGLMEAECNRLNLLVEDLLTLSSLDSNAATTKAEVFSLPALAAETVQALFPNGEDRRLRLEFPPDLPDVKVDRDHLRQILINLLDNAAKYSPPGTAFGIRAAAGEGWITVTVWDRGPGIPQQEQQRIFERFYRLDKARSRALGGTGLGLSIVKHLVEGYGGRVWVGNKGGTEFSFTVPRA